MDKSFDIILICVTLIFSPIICVILYKSCKNYNTLRIIKSKKLKIKPINYEIFIDNNIQELKKINEYIDVEYV